MKRTRSATLSAWALRLLSEMRTGSMSIPIPRAPYCLAAVVTIRPSPQPRS